MAIIAAVFMLQACSAAAPAGAQQQLEIRVISAPHPDLVSGGDALIEVLGANGPVTFVVNGVLAPPPSFDQDRGTLVGLVTGLHVGKNTLSVRSGEASTLLEVVNHSKDGPILSGPHIWPYQCDTEAAGLGPAVDRMCNVETRVERYYRTTGGEFKPLSNDNRPTDLASVTLPDGRTVPYVVRVESGTINRSIYRIAILDAADAREGAAWSPGPEWNRRLAVLFEGGIGGRYQQGFSPVAFILNDIYLSRGFAVLNASRLVNGLVSNAVLQGETLMMLKEHFIEHYGIPVWTVGTGGSGGAIQQLHITALYPGLLDGIQAEASFADSQGATHVLDCDLMENYWARAGGKTWTDEKKAAAAGHGSAIACRLLTQFLAPNLKVSHKPACGLNDLSLVYDPVTNPEGARCGMYSWLVNQLGRDPETGFPLSPWDNVGVQYGLSALNAGNISIDEFLDLNEGIGGYTEDDNNSPARTAADPETMRRLYASGLVNSGGGGLATTPVILSRKYGDPQGDFHDRQRDIDIRLRMIRANGDADNSVIWVGPPRPDPPFGAPKPLQIKVLDAMTRWLDAIASDSRPPSHAKTVSLRPADVTDAWFDENEKMHPEPATLDPSSAFNKAYPIHGNPRIAAGAPQTNDVLKCQLKSVDMSDYEVTFSADQMQRLRQIFPSGVCDFSKKGVGQVAQEGTIVSYPTEAVRRQSTYINPIDLPYRYQPIRDPAPGKQIFREAADPTVVFFKNRYWLFASHSYGYWWSTDLLDWSFVEQQGAAVEKYAPTAVVIGDRLYLATSDLGSKIWVTDDPMSGKWDIAADIPTHYWDPALFLDDDGRLYMYYGLSPKNPLLVEELDPKTFKSLTPPTPIPASREKESRGWEVVGDTNELEDKPSYIEGAWMTKHDGRYYLEYSAPGTEWKGYANGILTSDSPMGPFTYQGYNPFAIKPTGFVAGAGHGSTFEGPDGQWWHVGTTTISQRHIFERRLALFPARFTSSGEIVTDTYLADYPRYIDGDRELTGWMLLSRKKPVTVSSELEGFPAINAVDEEIRSWWSAQSGNPGEWLQIDLGANKRIEAVQINFADQDSRGSGISTDVYRYTLEVSDDGREWRTVLDTSAAGRDAPHDYRVLPQAVHARHVRLANVHSPDGGKFSLYDLRIFGQGSGSLPAPVQGVVASRNPADGRKATVRWEPSHGAEFYIVRVGTTPDLLTQSLQVYDGATTAEITTLNTEQDYFVAVDAVNDVGIRTAGTTERVQ